MVTRPFVSLSVATLSMAASPTFGQFSTYPSGSTMVINVGNAAGSANAMALPCSTGVITDTDTGTTSPTSLFPSGNTDTESGSINADAMACASTSYALCNHNFNLVGIANVVSVNTSYTGQGAARAVANDLGRPCDSGGIVSGNASTGFTSGTHTLTIPFTVTTTCFMHLDAIAFYLGTAPGSFTGTWSVQTAGGDPIGCANATGSSTVHTGNVLDVVAAFCCVSAGDYKLVVTANEVHGTFGGNVSCSHQSVDIGGPISIGFNVNVNFQDFCTCTGDVNNDGQVNTDDLLAVVGSYGPCPTAPAACPTDINGDGVVDTSDLLAVIGAWGECPCCLE